MCIHVNPITLQSINLQQDHFFNGNVRAQTSRMDIIKYVLSAYNIHNIPFFT